MALPSNVVAAIARLSAANNNAYNAATNPSGLGQGGHRQNYIPNFQAFVLISQFIAGQADDAAANAALTAEDASNTGLDRIATAQDRAAAAGSAANALAEANRAMGYANGLNLPGISAADALRFLRVKADGSGYETSLLEFASSAEAKAGTVTDKVISPKGVADAIGALAGDAVYEVITASSNFVKQDDDLAYFVECIGGGGSGSRSSSGHLGGGFPGLISRRWLVPSQLQASETVTVGAGGAPTTSQSAGNEGGDTSFGSHVRAGGGLGGLFNISAAVNTSYAATFGPIVIPVTGNPTKATGSELCLSANNTDLTGRLYNMPTMGGCVNSNTLLGPSSSIGYGTGGLASNTGDGSPGNAPGGGGGARYGSTGASGAGARGEVRIVRFKRKKV